MTSFLRGRQQQSSPHQQPPPGRSAAYNGFFAISAQCGESMRRLFAVLASAESSVSLSASEEAFLRAAQAKNDCFARALAPRAHSAALRCVLGPPEQLPSCEPLLAALSSAREVLLAERALGAGRGQHGALRAGGGSVRGGGAGAGRLRAESGSGESGERVRRAGRGERRFVWQRIGARDGEKSGAVSRRGRVRRDGERVERSKGKSGEKHFARDGICRDGFHGAGAQRGSDGNDHVDHVCGKLGKSAPNNNNNSSKSNRRINIFADFLFSLLRK